MFLRSIYLVEFISGSFFFYCQVVSHCHATYIYILWHLAFLLWNAGPRRVPYIWQVLKKILIS